MSRRGGGRFAGSAARVLEPAVFLNGDKGGDDLACPGMGMTPDRCACQIRCRGAHCGSGVRACRKLHQCIGVSVNAASLAKATWATLKTSRESVAWSNLTSLASRMQTLQSQQSTRPTTPTPPNAPIPSMEMRVRDDELCGRQRRQSDPIDASFGLFALTYRTPRSLEWSLRSWEEGGLLQLMRERLLLVNGGDELEIALGKAYNFRVVEPKECPTLKQVKPNVVTIGQAFAFALTEIRSPWLLFLEKDFPLVLPASQLHQQLYGAATLLSRGISVVYLRSRTQQGCDSFLGCRAAAWVNRGGAWQMRTNWWKFYCDGFDKAGRVADCIGSSSNTTLPRFRCYTSEDANWSLNAALINRRRALRKKLWQAGKTLKDIAEESFAQNDHLEMGLLEMNWGKFKVPLCISFDGLFKHYEVDG